MGSVGRTGAPGHFDIPFPKSSLFTIPDPLFTDPLFTKHLFQIPAAHSSTYGLTFPEFLDRKAASRTLKQLYTKRPVRVPTHGAFDCFSTKVRKHSDVPYLEVQSLTIRSDELGVDVVYSREREGKENEVIRFTILLGAIDTWS